MQLKQSKDITWDDLPHIESPFFARAEVERSLSGHAFRSIWGLDEVLKEEFFGTGSSFHQEERHLRERLLERIEQGELFLVYGVGSKPFSPVVRWQADENSAQQGRWIVDASLGLSARSRVERLIERAPRHRAGGLWNKAVGGAKELANQFVRANAAIQAEWMANKGIVKFHDTKTGQTLSPGEVAERYKNDGQDALPIQGAGEAYGAAIVRAAPSTAAVIDLLNAIGSRGKSVLHHPTELIEDVKKALTNTRSPQEALGKLGGAQAKQRLGIKTDERYVDRYHGPDDMGRDANNRLTEMELKGSKDGNPQVAKDVQGYKQGSAEKNLSRAKTMLKKDQQGKIGVPSDRQGGEYTRDEMALWQDVKDRGGNKRHVSVHTNTETGRVQVFERDADGEITGKLDDFEMENFRNMKQAIEEAFKR